MKLRSNIYIKMLSVYIALGFVVIMVTYYAVYCRPFSQSWATPVKNIQCTTYQYYPITQVVFNISSDAIMFAIPIPLLIRAQLKRTRKSILLCVMSLGLFTIVAATLNKYFTFASPLTTTYQIWYICEASSQESITHASNHSLGYLDRVEALPLEDWNQRSDHLDDVEIPRSTSRDSTIGHGNRGAKSS